MAFYQELHIDIYLFFFLSFLGFLVGIKVLAADEQRYSPSGTYANITLNRDQNVAMYPLCVIYTPTFGYTALPCNEAFTAICEGEIESTTKLI